LKIGNDKPTPPISRPAPVLSREITLRIISNWGDKLYVGLTEVSYFSSTSYKFELHMGKRKRVGFTSSSSALSALLTLFVLFSIFFQKENFDTLNGN
jgi:hypothetical protein